MNSNTPISDDKNNSQSSEDSAYDVMGDGDGSNNNPLNKSNIIKILLGVVFLVIGYFIFSSIFSSPTKPVGPDPMHIKVKGTNKVANKDAEETSGAPPTAMGGGDLPPPPVAMLTPPPPPVEAQVYVPPPIPAVPQVASSAPSDVSNTVTNTGKNTTISEGMPPPPPPPPPVPPAPEIAGIGKSKVTNFKDKDSKKRINSNMLIIDNKGGGKSGGASTKPTATGGDPNSAFSDSVIRATTAEKAIATGLNNLNMTIAQGKIINAVLETAINTDLPGTIRAIVSRDTYAETGRDVLIPKGSRIIGTYNSGVSQGQVRVMIVWTRVIRPDGIDIMIGSPGVDDLGRAGIKGDLDNKFFDIFSASILTTAISIGAAVAADAVVPSTTPASSTTTPEGNQTTTATPAQQAAGTALTNFTGTAKDVVDKIININPTITVDQGSLINIFVNRDLTFPSDLGGDVFIQ